MTDNISSEECKSDEERTGGPPPAKKLKQKMLQFSGSVDTATRPPLVLSHMRGRSQPSPARWAWMNLHDPPKKIMFLRLCNDIVFIITHTETH